MCDEGWTEGGRGRGRGRENEGARVRKTIRERERRGKGGKLFSLCFPFKDILTGQSPLCGRERRSHFEVSYRQLEGCGESE